MIGLVCYSPTLYRLFCSATGYGGTTQRVTEDTAALSDRKILVRFDSNVAPDLPWHFAAKQPSREVRLGEQALVFFTAENLSDKPIVGHAAFNVSPGNAGLYFNKIQCFCFNEEKLAPHEKVDMPVVFYVDPAMMHDADARDIATITLSYTFFRSVDPQDAKDLARFAGAERPDADRGAQLFSERCTACHALDANRSGPMLRGVFGRKAGTVRGYAYSPALSDSHLTWTGANLDRWLSGPNGFVAGARMPVRVANPIERRDIIAYLRKETPEQASAGLADSRRRNGS
jgi:cytochrome c oxidase assembly protein Cox11